jgi:hypothetical protein
MKRLITSAVAATALSVALLTSAGVTAASADQGLPDLKAQCHLGGEMFISGVPKGTTQVDYYSGFFGTVTSTKGPRFAAPAYGPPVGAGDWIYAFALDQNGNVLAQNHHVVCKVTD